MDYAAMQVARSAYQKATQPERKRPTLAYRAKMFGACPDCGMNRRICRQIGGCQP